MRTTPETTALTIPACAQTALDVLEGAGIEAWLVGGFVRDSILGRNVHDVDIACSAPWQQTKQAFEATGFAVHETGTAHGTVTAMVDGWPIEITTYRSEGAYSDGRHPDSVSQAQTIEEDLARRDFSINAIAYHPTRGFRDPYNGLADIEAGLIRCVGDARERFREDHLRILRACRFCSELGFSIEAETYSSMMHGKTFMLTLPAERVSAELTRFLLGKHVHDALMQTVDVLSGVVPELVAMKGFDQHSRYHKYDVLEHTAWVVQGTEPAPLTRWAALLHDIGKPGAYFMRDGVGHFFGHANVSVVIARGLLERLKFPTKMKNDILTLVELHDEMIGPTPRLVKRTLRSFGGDVELFRALCDLKRADALSHASCCTGRAELAEELLDVLDKVLAEDQAFTLSQLAITGSDVISECKIEAGPKVGKALDRALDAVIEERVANERGALIAYVKSFANNLA